MTSVRKQLNFHIKLLSYSVILGHTGPFSTKAFRRVINSMHK